MIFLDSRYADARLYRALDSRTGKYNVTVLRQYPTYETGFSYHEWNETDRLDALALRYLGSPSLWWQIMDLNPELIDPFNIPYGTQLRVPNE
jgi:prophage DNA circulation protein